MSGNFTVLSKKQEERLRKLEDFFEGVRKLVKEDKLSNQSVNRELDRFYANNSNWYSNDGQPMWGAGHGGEG